MLIIIIVVIVIIMVIVMAGVLHFLNPRSRSSRAVKVEQFGVQNLVEIHVAEFRLYDLCGGLNGMPGHDQTVGTRHQQNQVGAAPQYQPRDCYGRRHCDGLMRQGTGQRYGVRAVPPDKPVQPQRDTPGVSDYRGHTRLRRNPASA